MAMEINKITILKVLELIIAIICMILETQAPAVYYDYYILSTITFGGFIIILGVLIIGKFLGGSVDRKIDLFFNAVGLSLFIAVGAVNIDTWRHHNGSVKDKGLAKGALSIINAALFLIDSAFTYKS